MVLDKQNIIRIGVAISAILILLFTYRCGKVSVKPEERVIKEYIVKEKIKEIEGEKVEIIKWKEKLKIVKENTPSYPSICEPIVKYKDSIINIQDTIILKQDSIIYKYDTIVDIQKEIIELPCKKKLGFGAGFVTGVVVGGVGGVLIGK